MGETTLVVQVTLKIDIPILPGDNADKLITRALNGADELIVRRPGVSLKGAQVLVDRPALAAMLASASY